MDMVEAFNASYDTWQASDCKPIQHLSNTEPGMEDGSFSERRKHSWDIHYIPNPQLIGLSYDMIDVDVEAKGKNIALLNTRKKFNILFKLLKSGWSCQKKNCIVGLTTEWIK